MKYDLRDSGMSEAVTSAEALSIERQLDDLTALVERLGATEVDLWGHWSGARIAFEFAKRYEIVRRIVAWQPAWLSPYPESSLRVRAVAAVRLVGDLDLWAQNMATLVIGENSVGRLYARELRASVHTAESFERFNDAGASVPEFSASGVNCPVLVLVGARD